MSEHSLKPYLDAFEAAVATHRNVQRTNPGQEYVSSTTGLRNVIPSREMEQAERQLTDARQAVLDAFDRLSARAGYDPMRAVDAIIEAGGDFVRGTVEAMKTGRGNNADMHRFQSTVRARVKAVVTGKAPREATG